MPQWHLPLDPECPVVRAFYESLSDPLTVAYGIGPDLAETFEPKHRASCHRCQEYGAVNIEVA